MSVLKYKDPVTGEWKTVTAGGGNAEIPTALPNPYPLTINGISYDGSKAVDVSIIVDTDKIVGDVIAALPIYNGEVEIE